MSEELKKLEELLANDRKIIEDNYKEIERLKSINEEHRILNGELRKELQQKENIIKEAREYIKTIVKNTPSSMRKNYANMLLIDYKKLLEILDKGKE